MNDEDREQDRTKRSRSWKLITEVAALIFGVITLIYLVFGDKDTTSKVVSNMTNYTRCLASSLFRGDHLPHHMPESVELTLGVDSFLLPWGENLTFYYQSSAPGHVTVWNVGSSGKVTRLYPLTSQRSLTVDGNQLYRFGHQESERIEATGRTGIDDLVMVWTRHEDNQPAGVSYANVDDFLVALRPLMNSNISEWGIVKAEICIVNP